MARLIIVAVRGKEGNVAGWLIADGGDPRGAESTGIQLWPDTADPQVDPYTQFWLSTEISDAARSTIVTKMDGANSPPFKDVYNYYDETRTGPSILAELGLRTVDTPSP